MRRQLPPLNALLAFDAAARHRSFTAAAREMGVAQPAITRHIANLETWLNARLFERHGNSVSLTAAGKHLANVMTPALDRIELGVRDLPRSGRPEIIIGASFGITHLWLMPRLAAMRAATSVTVNFVTADAYSEFDRAGVDMSIRFTPDALPDHASDALLPEVCHVLASPEFIAKHPELDGDDLAAALKPEWLLDHGDPLGIGWITWRIWFEMNNRSAPSPDQWTEVRNFPAILDMVRHGEGVAIGSVGLEDRFVDSGEIIRLGPPLGRPGMGYRLVYARDAERRAGFSEVRAALLEGKSTQEPFQ